jgi:hypothetical protein
MSGDDCRRILFRTSIVTCALFLSAAMLKAQNGSTPTGDSSAPQSSGDLRALSDSIRQLQSQVQSLTSQLNDLRAEQQRDREESKELRAELNRGKSQPGAEAGNVSAVDAYSVSPTAASPKPVDRSTSTQANSEPTTEERLAKIEENQQFTADQLSTQSQSKVESGSKYRVRFSGIVLLNLFENRGTVDNQDIPQIAQAPGPFDSSGNFGGSLRQSQIGIEVFGPDIAGAHTSANLRFDFAGGFPSAPNGAWMGIVRLRTGIVRFDWTNTAVVAGQDRLFFAPGSPTSLAMLAVPPLAYSGNLWGWTPQVRVEHRFVLSDLSSMLVQAGILDSLTGDIPYSSYERYPSWGEESGQPTYATRVSWTRRAFGQELTIGVGGYYGRQFWGYNRNVDGWAGTADVNLPLGKLFSFSGEFYRGRAVGGLGGGIGQSVLFSGNFTDPTTKVRGLDSIGGWAQLKFKPTAKFEVNAALGDDNPFASEVRRYPATDSYYGESLLRNMSPFVNFIYQVRSNVLFSLEYRRLRTSQIGSDAQIADYIGGSIGYIF